MSFLKLLEKYRQISFSEHDKGARFERLMQAYLQTDPKYAYNLKKVWLWSEFPARSDFGPGDTGIDLVALTDDGDYWAIQCKCYKEDTRINKPAVDTFLSTSSKTFTDENGKIAAFSNRLWISTTNNWGPQASEAIKNQIPPVTRLNLHELIAAPVDWNKLEKGVSGENSRITDRDLRPHQKDALEKAHEYFKASNRGKLIMACGTGKTFTSLRIAENETNDSGLILFLAPSIALVGQTLSEWTAFAQKPIHAVCICSDPQISKKKTKNPDLDAFSVVDLALPASTNVKDIIRQMKRRSGMTVVFSTYQSIDVIANVQSEIKDPQFKEFDLIICDEAHRTTGVTLVDEKESAFVKVHDNEFIKAKKRLYMTATPRLYSDDVKSKAAQSEAILCSMDDPDLYGEEIYRIGFGDSVQKDLLTDYKVLVLTISGQDIPPALQKMISSRETTINTDDASKLIGCVNALSKQILGDNGELRASDPEPMRKAVAFCQTIKDSKAITEIFNEAAGPYIESQPEAKKAQMAAVVSQHIDGTMSAPQRDALLGWLKEDAGKNECRILTNVRCLSEGVDVPSLDAVMFLSARNSQIDVVQSVGRVMRKAPGKKYGYIIIPVVIPSYVDAAEAMNDNERYKVVWTVLNALRAHDDRFNATINKIELNKNKSDGGIIVGKPDNGDGSDGGADPDPETVEKNKNALLKQMQLQFGELQNIIYARMVQKVGDRRYWEHWAKNVAEIAERHVTRINRLLVESKTHAEIFAGFLEGLRRNINPNINQQDAVDMLSQHTITRPVFDALFDDYSFVKNNPVSISMQTLLDLLESEALEKDAEALEKFYESVKMRASGIDNAEGKQRIIIELYDKFFKTAFPKMADRLGIVYTPIEIVDFIINSVDFILRKEFDRSIGDENVHILDPFTGTGTFVTRLLQSGLIAKKDLLHKYKHEIHANEIVLLAYYIAAVNIENAFHDVMEADGYTPFEGICLTDTFQLGEEDGSGELFSELFPQNSERVVNQKKTPVRVIMGNPPYSVGQKSANDNAQNQKYEKLDVRIAHTYAAKTNATNKNSLYDSYIKAFRWSADRLDPKHGGIIAFITNSGWLEKGVFDGFRKCLEKEFSAIYVFDLKGSIRGKSGENAKREGQNVFDIMTGVAVTLLVKKQETKKKTEIFYHNIGEYLKRKEKFEIIKKLHSVGNKSMQWTKITPNEHGDWLNQRNDLFGTFIPIGDKKQKMKDKTFFVPFYGRGLATTRDAWCYNSSSKKLKKNIELNINFYNQELNRFNKEKQSNPNLTPKEIISFDSSKFSWSDNPLSWLSSNKEMIFKTNSITTSLYRPYFKQNVYFDRALNERVYQLPKLFPSPTTENLVICTTTLGERKDFAVFISNKIPDLHLFSDGCQCFPLHYYEETRNKTLDMFEDAEKAKYIQRDGISDFILKRAKTQYGKNVQKEDIFYYVYGLLHSPEYRTAFANDLKKMLPRLPLVDDVRDFWAFSKAGRKLADLHIHYETVPPYDGVTVKGAESGFFTINKMRFPQKKGEKDKIIYNSKITIENIPEKAYEYIVNGKSAIEWIMERYQITTHKDSGIRNDPNDWAEEVGNPRYILDLLLSIINVSIQTVDIVEGLPKIQFE